MELYHVTNPKLILEYISSGFIANPVRAWKTLSGAQRFSKQTGRRIILRITVKSGWRPLGGHQDQAMVCDKPILFPDCIQ